MIFHEDCDDGMRKIRFIWQKQAIKNENNNQMKHYLHEHILHQNSSLNKWSVGFNPVQKLSANES